MWLSEWYCFVYFDFYNWTFFILRPKGLNFFLIWFDPKDCFFSYESQNRTLFEHDWKNWTLWIRLKELNHSFSEWLKDLNFFWNMTQWIELFFNLTQRIEPFLSLKRIEPSSSFSWRKELNPFFGDSIEHFSDPKNWTFFLNTTHRIELFFWNVTQRIEQDFQKFDSKNWTLFTRRQRIEPSSQNDTKNWTLLWTWLTETFLNYNSKNFFLMKYDSQNSKNWTFFSQMSQRIELSEEKHYSQNWTWVIEIEPFFFTWLKELNLFFWLWLKELNFFDYDSKNWTFDYWLKELNLSLKNDSKNLFSHDSKNLTFFEYDSKNWTLLWTWLTETFLNYNSKNWLFFLVKYLTHKTKRIEPSLSWLKELNQFFWRLNWTLFWSTELNILFEHDSQNWTLFECDLNNWTEFSKILTQRIEPSSQNDSKNWTFLKIIWLQDVLNFFVTREMELFFNLDQKNWDFFSSISLKNDWPFFVHDSQNWTFFQHDSQNWTLLKNMVHRDWTLLFNMTQRKWVHFLVWLQE